MDRTSDAPDAQTDDTRRFKGDAGARAALANTVKLSDVDLAAFETVFYPGDHGPLWNLSEDPVSIRLIEYFAQGGKSIAAGCHLMGLERRGAVPFRFIRSWGARSYPKGLDEKHRGGMVPSGFGDVVVSGMGLAMGSGRAGGKLTAADAAFAQFKVMVTQADGSQIAQSLMQLGISEIRLTEDATRITLTDGSMINGQSTFVMNGVTRMVASAVLMAETQGYRVVEVVTNALVD